MFGKRSLMSGVFYTNKWNFAPTFLSWTAMYALTTHFTSRTHPAPRTEHLKMKIRYVFAPTSKSTKGANSNLRVVCLPPNKALVFLWMSIISVCRSQTCPKFHSVSCSLKMANLDLWHLFIFIANMMKPESVWNPFNSFSNPTATWIKESVLFALLCLLFSCTSITIPLNSSNSWIDLRVQNCSISRMASFLALLFLPKTLFWCIYFLIMLLSPFSDRMWTSINNLVERLQAVVSSAYGFYVHFTATITDDDSQLDLEAGGFGGNVGAATGQPDTESGGFGANVGAAAG